MIVLLCGAATATVAQAASGVGVLFGEVLDIAHGNKPISDAIIIVTSPTMQGEQTALSDEKGIYRIDQLPPGDYTIRASAPSFKNYELTGVRLLIGREVKVRISMVPDVIEGKEIVVSQIVSSIDQGSTATGLTLTKDYMEKVTTKRSLEAVTEAAPGAQTDSFGISFAGATSPENNFVVDGLNTTNTSYGTNGVNLPLEFFDQISVSVGGYLPEFGNATGGVVTAVTKVGGNEFHGSVFSYTTPLRLPAKDLERFGESIIGTPGLDIRQQLGFEVGGPIVKDYLWFHAGFAPTWQSTYTDKSFRRLADNNGDGVPDKDAKGNPVMETFKGKRVRNGNFDQVYAWTAKLTFNPSDKHRLSIGAQGNPSFNRGHVATGGQSNSFSRADESALMQANASADYSVRLNYDGKFADNKVLVNATIGYTIATSQDSPYNAAANAQRVNWVPNRDLTQFEPNLAGFCSSPFTSADGDAIPRCSVTNYQTGGRGYLETTKNERVLGNANISYIAKALGTHQLKAGIEIQHASTLSRTSYTGGASMEVVAQNNGEVYHDARRYGRLKDPSASSANGPEDIEYLAAWINKVYFNNYAAYAQDSWSIADRVNLNGGVRFDFQQLYGGVLDNKGQQLMTMQLANVSPRVGVIWDFLGNGRTKIFGSYGRFYQLIPLNALIRSQPAEKTATVYREKCSDPVPTNCNAFGEYSIGGGSSTKVAADITGQFIDQFQGGAEFQILNDLMVGINYQHSAYGNVIEDVSLDDAGEQFFIGNPGVDGSKACLAQQAKDPNVSCNASKASTFDPLTRKNITTTFPKPERRYDAMNVYLTKSLSRHFVIQSSYTLSFLRGNFSGLFRPETGQLNPNIGSDFDVAALLPNRYGYLPADRRHQFKLDGAYIFDVSERFNITPNIVFRVASGTPNSYTGAHPNYGSGESYIITRGTAGYIDPLLQVDGGVKFEYAFSKDTRLIAGITLINIGSLRLTRATDERFTNDNSYMRPVIGGTAKDLVYLKDTRNNPAKLNPNFGNATSYQRPMELRIDVKLTF